MAFSPDIVVLIFTAQFIAYTIKGLIGFGNPLISSPLLAMRLDNVVITPGMLFADCPINAYIAWKNRKAFQWRKILPLLIANMLGAIPGTLLLRFSLPWIIKTLLGIVVVVLGLEMATRSLRPVRQGRERPWTRLAVAFFSGICAGLFGINMFLTAYLQRSARDYQEFKGSICFLFVGENFFRFAVYAASGLMDRQVALFGLISLLAAVIAMVAAEKLAPHMQEDKLQKGAIVLFLLVGVSIIVKSILFHT